MTRALTLAAVLGLAGTAGAQQQIPSKVDLRFNRFVDADGIHDQMFRLAEAHPELCRVERIGTSSLGRPILALVICNPRTGDERDKPAMYIDGSIHANEIQASETVTYSAWYLLGAYGTAAPRGSRKRTRHTPRGAANAPPTAMATAPRTRTGPTTSTATGTSP
jgi:murein tripeptide amidase MpaA